MSERVGPCKERIYQATSTRDLALKRSCKHVIKQEEVTAVSSFISCVRKGDFIRTAQHLEAIFLKRQIFFLDKQYKLLIIFLAQVASIQRENVLGHYFYLF